ncbi:MAG: diacylglycerol kinase family protein [Proteobacteria bacterium]|nr:diacylglycerol kinase family protein [Pseudomonadota bacterium]
MKKSALIINPKAGSLSQKKIQNFIKNLKEHNIEVMMIQTEYAGHATKLAGELESRKDIDLITIAGGDGTINEVINGLNAYNKPIAIIPSGSANVLAWELGIRSIEDTLKAILNNNLLKCHIGSIECEGRIRKFILMAGIGFDGYVVKGVKFKGKAFLKKTFFILEGLKRFLKKEKKTVQLAFNGKKINCYSAIICKASKYGGNFVLAREGISKEPFFQVLAITKNSKILLLKLFFAVLLKLPYPLEILSFETDNLEIKGKKPVQIDGEFFGYTPCTISISKDTINLLTPLY